jgi:hypothetical protein
MSQTKPHCMIDWHSKTKLSLGSQLALPQELLPSLVLLYQISSRTQQGSFDG